jgi:hypothetical protein
MCLRLNPNLMQLWVFILSAGQATDEFLLRRTDGYIVLIINSA